MSLDLARWQFASTSIYHFLFVPVTIGLAFLVALLQTAWYRNGDDDLPPAGPLLRRAAADQRRHRRRDGAHPGVRVRHELVGLLAPRRQRVRRPAGHGGPGRLLLGVDVPRHLDLRLEPPLARRPTSPASGWSPRGRCSRPLFIMAANSWMQHPVGYTMNNGPTSPQLNNIWALFTNPVFLWGYTHVILASLVTGAVIMLGVSAWHLREEPGGRRLPPDRRHLARPCCLPPRRSTMFVGSELGVVEGTYQPMKIAAAEALWNTCPSHCSFSLFQIGGGQQRRDPDRRSSTSPTCCPSSPPTTSTARCRGSTSSTRSTRRSTARGTTCRTCSSSTGRCGSWPTSPPWSCCFALWGGWLLYRQQARAGQVVPAHRALGGDPALPHQHRRLDAHRERPPALDRPGADEDGRTASRPRSRPTDIWISLVVFYLIFAVARRRRRLADDPLSAAGPSATTRSPSSRHPRAPVGTGITDAESAVHEDEDDWRSSTRRSTWEA